MHRYVTRSLHAVSALSRSFPVTATEDIRRASQRGGPLSVNVHHVGLDMIITYILLDLTHN